MEVYKILNNIDLVNKDKLFEMATYEDRAKSSVTNRLP